MGIFDNVGDAPGQLSNEALQVTLKFQPGVPSAGQATISWNIPIPDNPTAMVAYAGITVVVRSQPVDGYNIPKNGLQFVADPTLDPDKFSGDTINGARVIGYFYEPEVIAAEGTPTTSFIVSDYDPSKNYYVCGYICDAQRRYDQSGSRAYSDRLGAADQRGTPAVQNVLLNFNTTNMSNGVIPTDGTGLVAGATYQFQVIYDCGYPYGRDTVTNMLITFDGGEAGTYGDMVKLINMQMAVQCNRNTIMSPGAPGAGIYYWDASTQTLYMWNGTTLVVVPDVIVQSTDPTLVDPGTYWYDSDNFILYIRNGSMGWDVVTYMNFPTDPTQPGAGTWWWDGTHAWSRCGNTWCEAETSISSTSDPSCPATPVTCAFWYDTTTSVLYTYANGAWEQAYAVSWPEAPNALSVGTYWFNLTNNTLNIRDTLTTWANQPAIINDVDPWTLPAHGGVSAGTLWYAPTTEILSQRDVTNTTWVEVPVLVWPTDPTDIVSCDLWYDTSGPTPVLKQWDILNSTWNAVVPYYSQPSNPYDYPTLITGTIWYNPATGVLSIWNGSAFEVIEFWINFPSDPTVPPVGSVWHDTTHNLWFVWNGTSWDAIDPIISPSDPTLLPVGQLWFDTSIPNHLWRWNGTSWDNILFTTTKPSLKKGQVWYDMTTGNLMRWDGSKWYIIPPCVICRFDSQGNLVFQTTSTGSNNVLLIPVPASIPWMASSCAIYGTGSADYMNDSVSPYEFYPYGSQLNYGGFDIPITYNGLYTGLDYFGDFGYGLFDSWVQFAGDTGGSDPKHAPYRALPISPNAFLWSNLKPSANVLIPYSGQDGVSGTPTYDQLGVGTDGSPDERRDMMYKVRSMLGYPTVTVELSDSQMNLCIQNALETLRQKSSMAVKRTCFFLDISPYQQHYKLTNKAVGFNKVVDVMAGYRFTSAFLSSAMGAGVYGQVVLQHLYNMGTFDLLSYHLVSQYVEQLEIMFATRLTFVWNTNQRTLDFHQSFTRPERILLDVTLEKTEQELLQDRYSQQWIQQYAKAEAMEMLAQIRGKYANLPGAGGSLTLNALDLRTQAKEMKDQLMTELDDLIVQDVESYGAYGSFVLG